MILPNQSTLTHLAVAEGCGGTTMALQYTRDILLDGGRAIWICERAPDPTRFTQLFEEVNVTLLSKLHLLTCGENISNGIDDARKLSDRLLPQIIVIDDWTPRTGHADVLAIDAIEKLQKSINGKCPILLTSSLYADASGKNQWKVRGENKISKFGFQTWLLTIKQSGLQKRILTINEINHEFLLNDEGFTKI